jgi:hypothetical protein
MTEQPRVAITINITAPKLDDPQLDRLKVYFDGMAKMLAMIEKIQENDKREG